MTAAIRELRVRPTHCLDHTLDDVHERTSTQLHLDEVEVALQVETRGPDHAARVLSRLRASGYPVTE